MNLMLFVSIFTGSYDGVMSKFDIATGSVQRCTGGRLHPASTPIAMR